VAVQSGIYKGVSAVDRAAERRERLLEATLEVWADPSRRTTMTAICAEAGLSERYFYESFTDLAAAQRTLLDLIGEQIELVTTAAREASGEDRAVRIETTMRAFAEMLVADPRLGRVAIIEAGTMPELRPRRSELLRHFAHIAAVEGHRAVEVEETSTTAEEVAGLLFIGGIAELVTAWLDGNLQASPDEIVDATAHAFLNLYT
jgi:AcrR family transcriptional regulator